MSDYFFKQYYNDVRDPLWPNISTYNEFLKLPTHIINECRRDLGLDSRLAELENREYWLTHGAHNEVYLFGNIGYVPTYKCAHSYYVNLFTELGWKKLRLPDIDVNNYQLFGLMINCPAASLAKCVFFAISASKTPLSMIFPLSKTKI